MTRSCLFKPRSRFQWAGLFILSTFFLAPLVTDASPFANADALRQWTLLLHEAQADGEGFYFTGSSGKPTLTAQGLTDEFNATLKALRTPIPSGQGTKEADLDAHPRCRFPARERFIVKSFSSADQGLGPRPTCPGLESFRARLDAKSVSVVFSSHYLNNPSSAYGHTFLKINRGRDEPLLDSGVGYAADVTQDAPLVYVLKGLMGLYPGTFTVRPYYYKVREYNDFEARDLWEYELELTSEEVSLLVDHLWELGHTYFDYKYFTENCSYHVLSVLNAVAPRLSLLKRQRTVVIPSDTLQVIASEPGLIRKVTYRPSVERTFRERIARLNDDEKNRLEQVLQSQPHAFDPSSVVQAVQSGAIAKDSGARVLDAAVDGLELKAGSAITRRDSEASRLKHELEKARSRLGVKSPLLEVMPDPLERPDVGHASRRASLGVSALQFPRQPAANFSSRFEYRFSLHDWLDPQGAYPERMHLEMIGFAFRWSAPDQRTRGPRGVMLDQLNLISVASLAPWDRFIKKLSWRFEAQGRRIWDGGCREGDSSCFALNLNGGAGLSFRLGVKRPVDFYALTDFDLSGSSGFLNEKMRLGAGGRLGSRIQFAPHFQFLAEGRALYSLGHPKAFQPSARLGARYGFSRTVAVGLSSRVERLSREAGVELYVYH